MSKFKIYLLPVLLLMTACSEGGYQSSQSVLLARVGNHYLTLQEARAAVPDFMMQQDSLKALQSYRKEWIQQKLLLQKANELQLSGQEAIQRRLQNNREQILTNALRQVLLSQYDASTVISDEEALSYYKNNKEQFILKERYVQFRHVSTDSIKYARAARQELLSETPWPEVARLYSENAQQQIKQAQKYRPQSTVFSNYPVLKQYIAELDSGQISPVRHLKGAYHFVQLIGSREAGETAKPEWILKQLKEWIMLEKKQQFFNSYVKNLYLNAMEHNEIELYNVLKPNESKTKPIKN